MKLFTEELVFKGIGGKAKQLRRLDLGGFPVPTWKVIAADVVKNLSVAESEVRLSSDQEAELREWLGSQKLKGIKRFIVRSSGALEDGKTLSMAGLFESFGDLKTESEIKSAIRKCIESASSSRVKNYLAKFEKSDQSIAVIVQHMVEARKSGVLFTADPKDGCRQRFLISATKGACEAVVSGSGDCDEYEVNASTEEIKQTYFATSQRSILHPFEIQKLVDLGKRITAYCAYPQDIEWVMDGEGEIFIVQTRNITSLLRDTSQQRPVVFDNSNIQESFNGLTLPLTFSFANEAYFRVYRQLMKVVGFSDKTISENDRRHRQMLGLIKGRVYYNINSWYQGLLLLPSFGRNKQDMEKMMGLESPVDFVQDQKMSRKEKLRRLPRMFLLMVRLGFKFSRMEKEVAHFRNRFQRVYEKFPRQKLPWMTVQELNDLFLQLKEDVLSDWGAPVLNDFYVMTMSGKVRRVLELVEREDLMAQLLAGEDLESLNPTRGLLELADKVKAQGGLLDQIEPEVQKYVEQYGDRVAGELKLETKTLREDRRFLESTVKSYVENPKLSLFQFEAGQKKSRREAEQEAFTAIDTKLGGYRVGRFKKDLKKFRAGVRYREAMRLDRTRSFGMFRSLFIEMGRRFCELGMLEKERDIFYLSLEEIDRLCLGQNFEETPKGLVALRKDQYKKWDKEKVPPQLQVSLPLMDMPKPLMPQTYHNEFHGLGCFPGEVEAEVVVVTDPNTNTENLTGKILVAERTDPGWTPLFLEISGLIVERGSQLSHSAVVAREFGIPTIVAVPGVVNALKTGDKVYLDGKEGQIVILPNAHNKQNTEESSWSSSPQI